MNKPTTAVGNPVRQTLQFGQSIWYDGLLPRTQFERMIQDDGIRGATTNPAIFEKAISTGEYDATLTHLAKTQRPEGIYQVIAVKAVQEVADLFLGVYEQSGGRDGFVSIEVSPLLAYDTETTITEARELWHLAGRKNVMIKIPATAEGLGAIRTAIAEGINVNVTLIFSLGRYQEVMDAYLMGLEDRLAQGLPIAGVASVASFFVSRVDTAVDKLLEGKIKAGDKEAQALLGRAGIANSKAAYAEFEKIAASERFKKLKNSGAQIQRPLWASTGTKNPNYKDVVYVEQLMGPDTVNTVPPATLDAFRDHGVPAARLKAGTDQAIRDLASLKRSGVDLDQVTAELETDGVKLFCDAYNRIIAGIQAKIR